LIQQFALATLAVACKISIIAFDVYI